MFKKNKHVFTCPDVIHLRNRQKKLTRISIAVNGAFFLGMLAAGKALEARDNKALADLANENPAEA